jgi:hypothetical protein
MRHRTEPTRFQWLAVTAVALYALFLCAAPFQHHDLSCELKTPQHCTSCTASLAGSSPDTSTVPGVSTLSAIGRAVALDVRADSRLFADRSTGRSPPAAV